MSKLENFETINSETDEAEHSLEMQLPYLKYIFKDNNFKIIPIMVGQTNLKQDIDIAKILLEYYLDPQTLFVISSDFCHWGKRFNFIYHNNKFNHIYESIEYLDKLGIEKIESLSSKAFNEYLSEYKNTICGRRPISILLCIIEEYKSTKCEKLNEIKFVKYDQSSKVESSSDSSVSYAVGINYLI